jgi:hypothetical protein
MGDIQSWLVRSGFRPVKAFSATPLALYRNATLYRPPFGGATVTFQRLNHLEYRLLVEHVGHAERLLFNEPFHGGWGLYAGEAKSLADWCKTPQSLEGHGQIKRCERGSSTAWRELEPIWSRGVLSATHRVGPDDSNEWIISADDVRRSMPRTAFRENRDGTVDVYVDLRFKPQAYFLLSIILGAVAFLAVAVLLIAGLTAPHPNELVVTPRKR